MAVLKSGMCMCVLFSNTLLHSSMIDTAVPNQNKPWCNGRSYLDLSYFSINMLKYKIIFFYSSVA